MMGGELLIVLGLVALAIFLVGGHGGRLLQGRDTPSHSDAREILAERFARGEISEDEFEQRTRVLERRPS
jgi:putative membrane protein